jgi:hypothetical protein
MASTAAARTYKAALDAIYKSQVFGEELRRAYRYAFIAVLSVSQRCTCDAINTFPGLAVSERALWRR